MATYTKDQLKTQVDNTFPTNGQGLIQAASHRTFLKDLIDSLGGGTSMTVTNVSATIEDENGKGCTFSAIMIISIGSISFLLIKGMQKRDSVTSFTVYGATNNLVTLFEGASYYFSIGSSPITITGNSLDINNALHFSIPPSGVDTADYAMLFLD